MPLEIRELVIKAQVGNNTNSKGTVDNNNNTSSNSNGDMVKQCVEKVLEILKDKTER